MTDTFDISKTPLKDILNKIGIGSIQLPDFQRGWVWNDERIKGLIASIAVSYPIGAVMLLENGNPDVRFKARPIHSVSTSTTPDDFILDGQQRLTTLYQTLASENVVDTKDIKQHDIKRWYYFDIKKCMDESIDIEESIVSIPEDKMIKKNFGRDIELDLSTKEYEFDNLMFPVNETLNPDNWMYSYMEYVGLENSKIFLEFKKKILDRIVSYQIPVIKMFKSNPKDAVCQVFEKVNTGGVSLNVFELLTATFAADDFNLRDNWSEQKSKLKESGLDVIKNIETNEILQSISLFYTYNRRKIFLKNNPNSDNLPAVSCKRKEILKLELESYKTWIDLTIDSIIKVGKLLKKNKIFKSRDLPYTSQIVPLSVIVGNLGDKFDNDSVKQKILKWYWCGILGEMYGGANETRFAKDVVEVLEWIDGGNEPSTIKDSNFVEDRLYGLKTRNSAAYKGIFAIQMQEGAKDFLTGDEIEWTNYYDEGIDIHHIFPKAWCEKNQKNRDVYDSIINKTPLTLRTNRKIGGNAPSKYIDKIKEENDLTDERFTEIAISHLINYEILLENRFEDFIVDRKEKLIKSIEERTGKQIQRSNNE